MPCNNTLRYTYQRFAEVSSQRALQWPALSLQQAVSATARPRLNTLLEKHQARSPDVQPGCSNQHHGINVVPQSRCTRPVLVRQMWQSSYGNRNCLFPCALQAFGTLPALQPAPCSCPCSALRHGCTALSCAVSHHPDPSYSTNCRHQHTANPAWARPCTTYQHLLCRSASVYCTRHCVRPGHINPRVAHGQPAPTEP